MPSAITGIFAEDSVVLSEASPPHALGVEGLGSEKEFSFFLAGFPNVYAH